MVAVVRSFHPGFIRLAMLLALACGWGVSCVSVLAAPPRLEAGVRYEDGPAQVQVTQQRLLLGDGVFSPRSAAYAQLNGLPISPQPVQQLTIPVPPQARQAKQVWLVLTQVQGLDTAEAHAAGESQANTTGTPLLVKTGQGRLLAEIRRNGAQHRVPVAAIPDSGLLTVRLEAGYQDKPEGRDYDDCQVGAVWLAWE